MIGYLTQVHNVMRLLKYFSLSRRLNTSWYFTFRKDATYILKNSTWQILFIIYRTLALAMNIKNINTTYYDINTSVEEAMHTLL